MSSFQSRLLIFAMQNRHLFRFKLRREVWDWDKSIPLFRQQCEQGSINLKLPEGIQALPVEIPGVTGIQGRQAE